MPRKLTPERQAYLKAYREKNPERIKAIKERYKAKRPKYKGNANRTDEGWRKVFSISDDIEVMTVWIRDGIIRYERGTNGAYSTPKSAYSVAWSRDGKRYGKLELAEKVK